MAESPSGTRMKSRDDSALVAKLPHASHQDSLPTRKRRQRRSCDQCRRGKRACDAGNGVDFPGHVCTNCLRKNQCCTFNWLKPASEPRQNYKRKQRHLSFRSCDNCANTSSTKSRDYRHSAGTPSINEGNHCHFLSPWMTSSSFLDDDTVPEVNLSDSVIISPDDLEDDTANHQFFSYTSKPARSRGSAERRSLFSTGSEWTMGRAPSFEQEQPSFNQSPSTGRSLGENSSRSTMTHSLLRIYHDSMENALSCWLTEHNCPYTMPSHGSPIPEARSATREWGASWSNRMYNRVVQLDRAYSSIRIRTLTAEEERTVSKALNMSVVAFASQWAQAGERSTRRPTQSTFAKDEFPQSNHFERSMQETLWHQTSQLLHVAATIDSFRVVFALIIFSLTQRPLDMTRPAPRASKSRMKYETFQALVQDEEAPLFLETALRQLLAQRRKLERLERESVCEVGSSGDPLRREDRATFNLLYWLGVMFDTLSAAICQRAVVVEDDDCELPRIDEEQYTAPKAGSGSSEVPIHRSSIARNDIDPMFDMLETQPKEEREVWGDLFIRNDSLPTAPDVTRWPCSYKLAASTLSSAAPVKVLLFRRVARLQALVSRRASAVRIEAAVRAAFDVYNHWNRVYNPFITDCVKYHDELPARVQSWYILLAGHWHLATFLLSDLLATIDATHLSLLSERLSRQISNLVAVIRRQNALAVADLSRSSIHGSLGEAQDFHFALNEAALLTEPWTVVFVRSLCRAGYILADLATTDQNGQDRRQAKQRCRDCIEGLWYLGRKSDMAFLAARSLSDMLDEAMPAVPAPSLLDRGRDNAWSMAESYELDTHGGAEDCVATSHSRQAMDPVGFVPPWALDENIGDSSFGNWLSGCGDGSMDTTLGFDNIPLVDTALQEQLWGY